MSATPSDTARRARSTPALALLAFAGVLLFALFAALGVWQLERRAWKLALIERVETRVHARPVDIPPPAQWPQVSAASDEYRHVRLAGRFLHDRETLVQASTVLGPGHWVLTPLRTAHGIVLVNRGFVPAERRQRASRSANEPAGEVRVTGLLRISEPGGGFLRRNDPAGERWFSRDVQAIAAARGLSGAAPFFVDEDAPPGQPAAGAEPRWPAPGLTVIAFRNHHLVYALTWFALALGVAFGTWWTLRSARQSRDASKP